MAEYTTNFRLIKPEDGATEWGSKLNDNFDTIDGGLIELRSKTNNNLTSSGVYSAVSFTISNSDNTASGSNTILTLSQNIACYFSAFKQGPSGGIGTFGSGAIAISEIESGDIPQSGKYINLYIYLEGSENSETGRLDISLNATSSFNDSWLTDGEHILLGEAVIYNDSGSIHFAEDLCACTPWRAEYSLNNRIEDFNNLGIINNIKLKTVYNNGTYLQFNLEQDEELNYTWYLEGINSNNNINANTIKNFLELDSSNIKFFKALPDQIYDLNELQLNTKIQNGNAIQRINGNALADLSSGHYTGYRIALTKTHNLVLFYTNIDANTKDEAIGLMVNLDPITTTISQKEIGRLIIDSTGQDTEIIDFYTNTSINELMTQFKDYLDPIKTKYYLADASEIRNTGYALFTSQDPYEDLPYITLDGIICKVNKNNLSNTSLEYITVNRSIEADTLPYGIYPIGAEEDGTMTTNESAMLARTGFIMKENKQSNPSFKMLFSPWLANTTDYAKENYKMYGLRYDGFVIRKIDNGNINLYISPNCNNILYGEGIGYNKVAQNQISGHQIWDFENNNFINPKNTDGKISFQYLTYNSETADAIDWNDFKLSGSQDYIQNKLMYGTNSPSYYTIQKLILLANGEWLIIGGKNDIQNISNLDLFTNEEYKLDHNVGIEIARIVTNGVDATLYFTYNNQNSITAPTISALASSAISTFNDSNFIVYHDGSSMQGIGFKVDATKPFTIKTSRGDRAPIYDLEAFALQTDLTNLNTKVGTQPESGPLAQDVYTCLSNLLTAISTLNNNIISTGTSAPGTTQTSWIYIDTSHNKVYVWDGSKYQLMNSWQ